MAPQSVVAKWLAHLPLVLEVPGSIPARGKENFGVQKCFLYSVICRDKLSGGVLDSRPRDCGFEPRRRRCVVVLSSKTHLS